MENKKNENDSSFDMLGLGGIFKGFEKLVDLAGKLQDQNEINKEGEINLDQLKKGMKGKPLYQQMTIFDVFAIPQKNIFV